MNIILKYFSDFTPQQLNQFAALQALYAEWNSRINIISRKDIDSLYEKHVLHSLSIAALFKFTPQTEILDLGTGGGFPGIPLAIFFPEVKFHLVDSIRKKITVVNAIADAIGLKNVSTEHTRIEDMRNRKFDFVVSRAVAPLKDLWSWSKPLLKKSGVQSRESGVGSRIQDSRLLTPDSGLTSALICLKGGDLSKEIAESGCKPKIAGIYELFLEEYFKEKFILVVNRSNS